MPENKRILKRSKIVHQLISRSIMNQLIANKLNEEGAIILILEMQVGAEIGLDYNSWLVGTEFMGFKMINPGFHCLFYRLGCNCNVRM